MDRYLAGLLDPLVGINEVQHMMYFTQESGEGFGLSFDSGPHGPYSVDLIDILSAANGHLISGITSASESSDQYIDVLPGALRTAAAFLQHHPRLSDSLDRVGDLIEGFESSYGLELLATVHWLATREHVTEKAALVEATYAWNARKRRFTPRQIGIAADTLTSAGWIAHA